MENLVNLLDPRNQTQTHTLTYDTQDEQELGSILIETEVYRLRIHNGTDQATFSCKKP